MKRRYARGVTLVELMIVVAIIGVLAVIGFVGYRKLTNASHTAEATQMVGAIRAHQERYKSEIGSYAGVSLALGFKTQNQDYLYPHCTMPAPRPPGNFKVGWGGACPASKCGVQWSTLGVESDGPVMYGYTTTAGKGSSSLPSGLTIGGLALNLPSTLGSNDAWYLVSAVGDADGNGKFSTVLGSSFDNELRVDADGE